MKRRVASLPPVPSGSFNEKVIERREQNAVRIDPKELTCRSCSKTFSTENAFLSHTNSKRHLERERTIATITRASHQSSDLQKIPPTRTSVELEDEEPSGDITERLASARRQLSSTSCLFCSIQTAAVVDLLNHMSQKHSFFIPERELLVDLPGLLGYLGEKVAVGNLCLYCPNGGREFASLEAVRSHMIDKGHCKIAYALDEDLAELSEYYSWGQQVDGDSDSEWEDTDTAAETGQEDKTLSVSRRSVSLAEDGLSLLLPSGRVLGHRSLKVYYAQQFRPARSSSIDANDAKVQRIRQRLADPTLALVPVAGGAGAYGRGLQVVKARNAGEAAWVRKQARSFRDQRVREDHKTRVGYIHNSQKHFRDPLLQ